MLGNLADEFYIGMGLHDRANFFLPIKLVSAVHLGRNLQRHSGPCSDFDCVIRSLFRRDSAEESQIAAGDLWLERNDIINRLKVERDALEIEIITLKARVYSLK